ncbi:ABC-2 type transport system permease protein [Clostridium acetobutylicum]|uniref:Predicted permease n=2 Tax=Clostridium acetobutylicum TaxID=1488 RepID=Q97MM4_CLOAB|nr:MULTISPECIES: ABC transporter permease [Clostridium]AAK78154.1 Predicted permease [Clostridium acetobutylicum ATCC 824]ADZ19216.1 permease [Clostridium acetobutylicum EA 2018]AEI34647.1 permease [Clostridium acetobutylicum DSM 1731]AWV81960.1 ABC transporter permease [Clostridium acetobutylicum]MBC2395972.1 ABC transporter permease [Clostridium acetobutylicum]
MHILSMIKSQLKLLFNNRLAVFAIILAPILLTFLVSYSSSSNSKTNVYFADQDNTEASRQLVNMLKNNHDLNLISSSESEIKNKVDDDNITVGVLINKGFGYKLQNNKALDITLIEDYDSVDGEKLSDIILSTENTLQKVNLDSKSISRVLSSNESSISNKIIKKINNGSGVKLLYKNLKSSQNVEDKNAQNLIGFLLMFLWFIVIQGFRTLIEEKENNTFNRIKGTPTNYSKYLLSKIIANYIFGMIIIAIILIVGKYGLKSKIINNVGPEIAILSIYLFSIVGLVMIFVPFVKKHQTFTIIGAAIMVLTGLLGGSFFSMDELQLPKAIEIISKFMPETWGIKSLKEVVFNNLSLGSQSQTILVLGIAGIVGLLISTIIVKIIDRTEKNF